MTNRPELADAAQTIADELKKLTADTADSDALESLRNQASDLASDLDDAWNEAYEEELAEDEEQELESL